MKRKAQSEIVGFTMIIIIVAVLILVFLGISMNKNKKDIIESYEAEAFVQSMFAYTTTCEERYEGDFVPLRRLISLCKERRSCFDSQLSCDVLEYEIEGILNSTWKVGNEWPAKGYFLNLTLRGEELMSFKKGNITNSNRGSSQTFPDEIDIIFVVYE